MIPSLTVVITYTTTLKVRRSGVRRTDYTSRKKTPKVFEFHQSALHGASSFGEECVFGVFELDWIARLLCDDISVIWIACLLFGYCIMSSVLIGSHACCLDEACMCVCVCVCVCVIR
jgi:hypothetical protein